MTKLDTGHIFISLFEHDIEVTERVRVDVGIKPPRYYLSWRFPFIHKDVYTAETVTLQDACFEFDRPMVITHYGITIQGLSTRTVPTKNIIPVSAGQSITINRGWKIIIT